VELLGPTRPDYRWQARAGRGFDASREATRGCKLNWPAVSKVGKSPQVSGSYALLSSRRSAITKSPHVGGPMWPFHRHQHLCVVDRTTEHLWTCHRKGCQGMYYRFCRAHRRMPITAAVRKSSAAEAERPPPVGMSQRHGAVNKPGRPSPCSLSQKGAKPRSCVERLRVRRGQVQTEWYSQEATPAA
jgi:hypothetical protein